MEALFHIDMFSDEVKNISIFPRTITLCTDDQCRLDMLPSFMGDLNVGYIIPTAGMITVWFSESKESWEKKLVLKSEESPSLIWYIHRHGKLCYKGKDFHSKSCNFGFGVYLITWSCLIFHYWHTSRGIQSKLFSISVKKKHLKTDPTRGKNKCKSLRLFCDTVGL